MSAKQFRWALAVTAMSVVVLPGLGNWYRRQRQPRCALDGAAIEPIYAVEVIDDQEALRRFCCIRCAKYWLERQSAPPRQLGVTDEVTGRRLDAVDAFFVRSAIVTNRATGNRIHVFRARRDAEEHAMANGGRLLQGDDRPFASVLETSRFTVANDRNH